LEQLDEIQELAREAGVEPHLAAAQIYRDKGVVFYSENGELVRVVHMSTVKPGFETPTGKFKVYSQERNHWSHSYNVNLPWASFFHEGYAFHEYSEVPAQPASHGCARQSAPEAPWVFDFLDNGTPVYVY
jgi:lipoprotein-anchoring transpeptidase ErfK/SrfK